MTMLAQSVHKKNGYVNPKMLSNAKYLFRNVHILEIEMLFCGRGYLASSYANAIDRCLFHPMPIDPMQSKPIYMLYPVVLTWHITAALTT